MIEPSLALQAAFRTQLVSDETVVALVSPSSIRDGNARPDQFPCVILGDATTVLERIVFSRKHVRTTMDIHLWTKETGLAVVKTIAAAAMIALSTTPVIDGFALLDHEVESVRYLRDPGGEHGHAVVTVSALIEAID